MKTFILFWNPAISSYKLDDFQRELEEMIDEYNNMNWSVWEYEEAHAGDRFFMVRCGSGKTGICMSGYFSSNPYKDEDWSGRGRITYYMNLEPDIMLHPDYLPILTTNELISAIPSFDWRGGHSGRLLDKENADKLESLWKQFTEKNDGLFVTRAFRQEVDPSNYIIDENDPICCYLSLTEKGKVNVYSYQFDIDKDCETISKAKEYALETLDEQQKMGKKVVFKYDKITEDLQNIVSTAFEKLLSINVPQSYYKLLCEQYDEEDIIAVLLYCLVIFGGDNISSYVDQGFSQEVIDAVKALLPISGETDEQHLNRIEDNAIATSIKIDMLNIELDLVEVGQISVDDVPRLNKAIKALRHLIKKDEIIMID